MAKVLVSNIKVGHIDDVQELRKTNPKNIPQRFVRDDTEKSQPITSATTLLDIPTVDFSKLLKGITQERHQEILKLSAACEEWGFFQVKNHGISQKLLDSIEELSKDFFMLPSEEKKKYPMIPGIVQGYGQAFVFSENQKLDWCNMFALVTVPPSERLPHLWPNRPEGFSETLEEHTIEVRKLCQKLLEFIALGLGLKEETFSEMFGEAVQGVRMNYYPPCSRPDLVMGLSPHSDGSAITVLQEAKGSPVGLEILKNSTWFPVQPDPNALFINLGDTLEVVTNGKYKSVEHRAVANEEKDRMSIVTFYAPSYEVEIGPMPEFVDENNPIKFKRYNHGEYAVDYLTNKLRGKKSLDFGRIQTQNSN
ncbi:hypothetical protein QN277_000473 [Acacia crassicarpa]|uniref:Fe2OG dioxygenase domain-containing protein n=1 Tax=Acacia crassicarpa TaxID=499986 RepID=A0AAE1TFL6_9FABA|nr:hypothetical protein QN277_000473 [Acacia crassicarpa]